MTDTPLPATFTRSYNMKKILFTICGRAGSKGVAGKNLKTIYGKPMVYYSLSAIDLFIKENPEYRRQTLCLIPILLFWWIWLQLNTRKWM